MSPKGSLWPRLRKASKPQPAPLKIVFPHLARASNSSTNSEMDPSNFASTGLIASDVSLDPVTMASTISQARLTALTSGEDTRTCIQRGKDCVDAYAQATKAMMDNLGVRINNGEDLPYEEMIDEMTHRCYKYCQSLVDEVQSLSSITAIDSPARTFKISTGFKTSTDSTKDSSPITPRSGPKTPQFCSWSDESGSPQALLAARKNPLRVYTVSNDEWIIVSGPPSPTTPIQLLAPDDMDPVDASIHFGVILRIFTKLYTMSKIMQAIFLSYGVEIDTTETGLTCWVRRAEQNMYTQEMKVMIDIVENLFYALYARVTIELANIELCGSFRIDLRSLQNYQPNLLPEADHLYRIILAFKDVLDSPEICPILRKDFVAHFQQEYISHLVDKDRRRHVVHFDPLGYRSFATRVASDRGGDYCQKWRELIPCFNVISADLLTTMSEKYTTVYAIASLPDDIPYGKLPWIKPEQLSPQVAEAQTIKDHRMSALAKLEGTSIGDERQKDPQSGTYYLIKQHKCICSALCRCSKECTQEVVIACPCAERHVRTMVTKRSIERRHRRPPTALTASTLARMYFYGLSALKRHVKDEVIASELNHAFELINLLIMNERKEADRTNTKAETPDEASIPNFF
ncbi:hypothetical protein N7457_005494 [Penicillium paradoxum]|uniref:uncharacterized protein n=1 Tax=Penicillium paradoxum TaxID=176176 RepID=UPI002548FE16|nr:uncharacterized protein N7457_005494 [Penicillium paradoxum]KAJ5780334.1 hypothetical protein N7457_005494 [Penicillium paradoxum]